MTAEQAFEITIKSNENDFELYNRCLNSIIKEANKGETCSFVDVTEFEISSIENVKKFLEMKGFKVILIFKKCDVIKVEICW
jgi:ribosome biogenesis GTPase A